MAIKEQYNSFSSFRFSKLYNIFMGLSLRNQMIGAGIGVFLVILLIIFPLSIVSGKIDSLKEGIASTQNKIQDVLNKVGEYERVKQEAAMMEKKFGALASMTSKIESLARDQGLEENIEVLKEKNTLPRDRIIEVPIELKMRNITLEQLVDLVYEIENQELGLMRVKKLKLTTRFSNRSYLEVDMDVVGFKLKGES
jgi:hypothetical protein